MKLTMMIGVLLLVGLTTSVIPFAQTVVPPKEKSAGAEMKKLIGPTLYVVEATVDPELQLVYGKMQVTFTPRDEKQVYFHLYPNAFQESGQKASPLWNQILGTDSQPGRIDIEDVVVMDKVTPVTYHGESSSVMQVPLQNGKEQTRIEMSFRLQVPKNNGRMSYDTHAMWLGNWLPIMAVKDASGWRLDPYAPIGDPFYSETANYQVKVTLPASYSVATSGYENQALVTESNVNKGKEYQITAERVRDFAMVIVDGTYKKNVTKQNGTTINTWYQDVDNSFRVKNIHDTAVASLAYYNQQYGPYPYPEYDVVKTGGFFGGMEYPGIVFIQSDFFNNSTQLGTAVEVVAHETAHQWFYGLVGNDESREPWVDESLTTYASLAFLESYDSDLSQHLIIKRKTSGELAKEYARSGLNVRKPVTAYPNMKTYSQLVYSRGSAMLWALREEWGVDKVNQVLKQYVAEKQFKVATEADVKQAFSRAAGADAQPFFDYWLGLALEKEQKAKDWLEKGK